MYHLEVGQAGSAHLARRCLVFSHLALVGRLPVTTCTSVWGRGPSTYLPQPFPQLPQNVLEGLGEAALAETRLGDILGLQWETPGPGLWGAVRSRSSPGWGAQGWQGLGVGSRPVGKGRQLGADSHASVARSPLPARPLKVTGFPEK